MKSNITEPPGRLQHRSKVISLPHLPKIRPVAPKASSNIAPIGVPARAAYLSVAAMVQAMSPVAPVYCLRPATIRAAAAWFIQQFPGDVLYAVKTNPDPQVLATLAQAGIRHYDVASLTEVKLVADLVPDAKQYFMHPVKSREAIAAAYFNYSVRDFSLDCQEELQKILEVTGYASDLNLYVRLTMPNATAAYSLFGKFGIAPEQSVALLKETRKASRNLGICFHVGSQCMEPDAYAQAMQRVAALLQEEDITIDTLDIGGGFPSIYPGLTPPPMAHYMQAIKQALSALPVFAHCQLLCEPGRALVAEGGSTVARVELRKGNMLYLNEGTYGSLFDAGTPGFVFPVKALRTKGVLSDELAEFSFFGPTCDSMDAMKGPFHLPKDIAEGDWIEIGQLGSYGATMATKFNGFEAEATVEVADKPLLSMLDIH